MAELTDTREARMLKEYQQTGSPELREKLINEYIHLVRSAAVQMRGMASGYAQEEDLVNQGVLALMDCLERYDETRGAKFETFAFLRVRGSLIDFVRSQDWVPHRARSLQRHIEEAFRQLANEK